jgi:hypothetical protein
MAPLVAQDLAARTVLNAALRSERHRDRFPRLEWARNRFDLMAALLKKEETL